MTCNNCNGSGRCPECTAPGMDLDCWVCYGSGECQKCGGSGEVDSGKNMNVGIIENADSPELAQFMAYETGERRLFNSCEEADNWLMDNAESGVVYQIFCFGE